jgi:hypothetical protein
MNMPRLEDKEILSKERDSPHERTTRQVRTDLGWTRTHLSSTKIESLLVTQFSWREKPSYNMQVIYQHAQLL